MCKVKKLYHKKNMAILVAIFFLILDRFLKILFLNFFSENSIRIIGEFFQLRFVPNYYIAFSIPFSGIYLNILIFVLIIFILYQNIVLWRAQKNKEFFCFFLIFLGAISNFWDRLRFAYVVDYLDLKYFTVFNIADSLICLGAFGLIMLYWNRS